MLNKIEIDKNNVEQNRNIQTILNKIEIYKQC